MDVRELLARNVRRLRVERGLSQERLAVDAHIDRTYVSKLERAVHAVTVDVLQQIADALGVPVGHLLEPAPDGEEFPENLPSGRRAG